MRHAGPACEEKKNTIVKSDASYGISEANNVVLFFQAPKHMVP
jgi:hypothetical protein